MRTPSPTRTHRAKDFCTIEQASYIAQQAVLQYERAKTFRQPHRRFARLIKRSLGRLRAALRISGD